MSEEVASKLVDVKFWDSIDWTKISHGKIGKEDFFKMKHKYKKVYSSILGAENELSIFFYKPMMWPEYKEIRKRGLDKYETQEFIINSCIVWPKQDVISLNTMEAGILLTLVYQIMAVSYFLNDPSKALEMIIEC